MTVLFLKTDYQNSTNDGTKHFYKFYLLMKIFSTNFTRIIFYDVHSFCVDENLILQRQRVRREQGVLEEPDNVLKENILLRKVMKVMLRSFEYFGCKGVF